MRDIKNDDFSAEFLASYVTSSAESLGISIEDMQPENNTQRSNVAERFIPDPNDPLAGFLNELANTLNEGHFVQDWSDPIVIKKLELFASQFKWRNPQLHERLLICINKTHDIAKEISDSLTRVDPVADAFRIYEILRHNNNFRTISDVSLLGAELCKLDEAAANKADRRSYKASNITGVFAYPFKTMCNYQLHFKSGENFRDKDGQPVDPKRKLQFSRMSDLFGGISQTANKHIDNLAKWRELKPFGTGWWHRIFASKNELALNECIDKVKQRFAGYFPVSDHPPLVENRQAAAEDLKKDAVLLLTKLMREMALKHTALMINKKLSRSDQEKLGYLYKQFEIVSSLALQLPGKNDEIEELALELKQKVDSIAGVINHKDSKTNVTTFLRVVINKAIDVFPKLESAATLRQQFEKLQKSGLVGEEAIQKIGDLLKETSLAQHESPSPSIAKLQEQIRVYVQNNFGRGMNQAKPQTSPSTADDIVNAFEVAPRVTESLQTERKVEARMN